jgi:MYXO-CTERM domain-containing protein
VYRRLISCMAIALGATALVAGPASATTATRTVTSPIKTGSDAKTVGTATFTRTLNNDGTTTVTVVGQVGDGIKESHLCYSDTGPFTSRVSPGSCPLGQGDTGTSVTYSVSFPASDASKPLYFQFHLVSKGNTAYAGWHSGSPFYGNVQVDPAEAGTPVPVGTVGGIGLAAVAGVALLVGLRRRSAAAEQR